MSIGIKEEIQEEFDYLSGVDFKDNYSIGRVCDTFGFDPELGGRRGFQVNKERLPYNMGRLRRIKLFSEFLLENGNIKYAQKQTEISAPTALKYVKYLNNKAVEMGYPLIYERKEHATYTVLNEKQVSYVKYLVTKYSCAKVAKMYKVTPPTIYLIKTGRTWKGVEPAIINEVPVLLINQYGGIELCDSRVNKIDVSNNRWIKSHVQDAIYFVEKIKFKDNNIVCPKCKNENSYRSRRGHEYRCSNSECKIKFSITTMSHFHGCNIPINKILAAIYAYIENDKVPSTQLSDVLNIRQATCHSLVTKIKYILNKNFKVNKDDIDFYFKNAINSLFKTKKNAGVITT